MIIIFDTPLQFCFPALHADDDDKLKANLKGYMAWDDWKVLGMMAEGEGGEHADRLHQRNHYREIYNTPECPVQEDLDKLARIEQEVKEYVVAREEAGKSWYKVDQTDIPVVSDAEVGKVMPLSRQSAIVASVRATRRVSLFALPERATEARAKLAELIKAAGSNTSPRPS
jgi:hypothetical protein